MNEVCYQSRGEGREEKWCSLLHKNVLRYSFLIIILSQNIKELRYSFLSFLL
jgi:hypothetical protein